MTFTVATGISTEAYEFISRLVYQHSRIRLGRDKQTLVVSRLGKRLRQLGLSSFEEYCELLKSPQGGAERSQLLDLISTNHTQFFREWGHFEFLLSTMLPEWSRSSAAAGEPLRVWSAACSSGEEPYSIAIALAEYFQAKPDQGWRVDASDISTRMLRRASEGIYRLETAKMPKPEWLRRYFLKGTGKHEGYCQVKEELRRRVSFHHLNLFQPNYPVPANQSVIFCRNVMIYFDRDTCQQLVERLAAHLAPGGYFIVGHSESLVGVRHALKAIQPAIYRLG
jgi:chemotaxis protein methyltransferase CheR